MGTRSCWMALAAALLAGTAASAAQEIDWQEAVARLARERTQAEACAGLLKKYGSAAAIDRGSLAYADAKSEYDGIVAGLDVALARKKAPESLADLQTRLQRGFDKREAFCKSVDPLIPNTSGHKGAIEEIVSGTAGPLIQALQAIYMRWKDDDALTRKTIETQLEATTWPAFASVPRSP